MKLPVKEIFDTPYQIELRGDEPWLQNIYGSFAQTNGLLTAQLSFRKDLAGFVYVSGNVAFTPYVDCSRCSESIPWPVAESVEVTYRPEGLDATPAKEVNLKKRELEQYAIANGMIDLEELVNDIVQMAIPLHTVRITDDGKSCVACGIDVTSEKVWGGNPSSRTSKPQPSGKNNSADSTNDDSKTTSPFAVLAGLKLKK